MKSIEFQGIVASNRQITIPDDIARQLPAGERLRILLEWDTAHDDDDAWRTQGRRQFEGAYVSEDAVYEQLMDETPPR